MCIKVNFIVYWICEFVEPSTIVDVLSFEIEGKSVIIIYFQKFFGDGDSVLFERYLGIWDSFSVYCNAGNFSAIEIQEYVPII